MTISSIRRLALSGILLTIASSALGQAVATKPAVKIPVYDVVSIKPNKSGSGGMSWSNQDDSFEATNASVMIILMNAYGIREDQISGAPEWVRSTRFDLKAKVVDPDPEVMKNLTNKQRLTMLQGVLASRFKLQAHTETRTLPVYDMVVAKGGSKLKPAPPAVVTTDEAGNPKTMPRGSWTFGNGTLSATAMSSLALANQLASELEHTVIDKTGLTGVYDLTLKWTQDDGQPPPEGSSPSLFTAVQEQLGLKLQPAKGPVGILVIDHIELPSDNEN